MPLLHEVRDNSSDAGQDKNFVGSKPLVSMFSGMMLSSSGGIVEENTPTPTKVKRTRQSDDADLSDIMSFAEVVSDAASSVGHSASAL